MSYTQFSDIESISDFSWSLNHLELWLVKSTWFLASSLYSKINILRILSQYEIIFLWLRFRFASHCGFSMSNNWNLYNNLFNFNENDTRRCALWMCYLDTWLWFPLLKWDHMFVVFVMRWITLILLLLFELILNFSSFPNLLFSNSFKICILPLAFWDQKTH